VAGRVVGGFNAAAVFIFFSRVAGTGIVSVLQCRGFAYWFCYYQLVKVLAAIRFFANGLFCQLAANGANLGGFGF
jgi:hypothetical protein